MADGTKVVEPVDGPWVDNLNSVVTTIDSVEKTFDDGPRKRQRITVADNSPRLVWDEAVGVTSGTTVDVAPLVGEENLRVVGFTATGTGDARFRLLVDGAPVLGGYINVNQPVLSLALPVGVSVPAGSTAGVQILADGDGPCDYEATIYGEVTHG